MSRLTRDGTSEPVTRDQILRPERGQGNIHFTCSADHEQDWQPYTVNPYSCYMCDHTFSSQSVVTIDKKNSSVCVCVFVCVSVFIKLHITAQSGPVILVTLCSSYWSFQVGINDTCYENMIRRGKRR